MCVNVLIPPVWLMAATSLSASDSSCVSKVGNSGDTLLVFEAVGLMLRFAKQRMHLQT